jgi:hypothetical protein
MYANEDLMLKFFYENDKELDFLAIEEYFTDSDFGQYQPILDKMLLSNLIDQTRYQVFKITDIGREVYKRKLRDEKSKRRAEWPKTNWILADIIKIMIGLILGYCLRVATETNNNPRQHQIPTYQQLPKNPDTSRNLNLHSFYFPPFLK